MAVVAGTSLTYAFTYFTTAATDTPTFTYAVGGATVSAPTFSPAAGSYASAQTVALADTTAGAVIHYTLDGSTQSASCQRTPARSR